MPLQIVADREDEVLSPAAVETRNDTTQSGRLTISRCWCAGLIEQESHLRRVKLFDLRQLSIQDFVRRLGRVAS